MRVAVLSANAPRHNAIGNQTAEKVRFFQERGAEVRLFVQDSRALHPDLQSCCTEAATPSAAGPAWDFLRQADLVIAVYAQYFDLLQWLPRLAGQGPRLVFDYHGVTPTSGGHAGQREGLDQSARQRGFVWFADHALTSSQANRRELLTATRFPAECTTTLPLSIDFERFRGEPGDAFLQTKLGIHGHILLYVGRLASNKRVPLLIEALAQLESSVHVVVVGDTSDVYAEEAARCLTLAEETGVAARVHLLGQLEDAELARAYRSADALVLPSVHEGFCVPVLEAMASGLPVIGSRSAALPETIGDAGLTFVPNDADDLARQIRRVLAKEPTARGQRPRRIAVAAFRFGADVVGGAETSLRTMAKALQGAGHVVEIFTTCTKSESRWRNELPAGASVLDGLPVQRFPIDAHDAATHGELVRAILEADGNVSPDVEQRYLQHSIHSTALLEALEARQDDFDAIITGPYLFGLSADIARAFPAKTLLVPCFHDEAIARLRIWPTLYGSVGGLLYHSIEEQAFAQQQLGVNHPNARHIGTCLTVHDSPLAALPPVLKRPYVVYCGRYSAHKNVPLLVDWARRYQETNADRLDFVFLGQGDEQLPNEPWLHNLGHVSVPVKRAVLAGAKALVQLSRNESLSLVVLEAWAEGTPVIVHEQCAVLAGQVARSGGGVAVADQPTFAAALEELLTKEAARRQRGVQGQAFVQRHYVSADAYAQTLSAAIDALRKPLAEQMRTRGIERARLFRRAVWQQRFAEIVEQVLTQPARPVREDLRIEPLRHEYCVDVAMRTLLVPVRLVNRGTHAAIPDGPGRTMIRYEIQGADQSIVPAAVRLPALLAPGQESSAPVPISLPGTAGSYRVTLWLECMDAHSPRNRVEIAVTVAVARGDRDSCAGALLDTVQETLPRTHALHQLPANYVDVSEGRLAPVKRLIKRKLLGNFKHAYVDVLSRQQSQVNGQMVLMIQQLAECCALLDHAVAGLHQRLDGLEAKLEAALISDPRVEEIQG